MNKKLEPILSKYKIQPSDIISIEELPTGINFVYLIKTKTGKFILKNYRKVRPPYLINLHECLVKLIENGALIPPIQKNESIEFLTELGGEYYDLSKYIEHVDISDQVTISQDDLVLSGKTLAQLQKTLERSGLASRIKRVDFKEKLQATLKAIEDFLSEFEAIHADTKSEKDKSKLTVLRNIIIDTNRFRAKGIDAFSNFLSQPYVPTHGDFSMANVLIKQDRSKVFVTDWDGLSLRPLVWDLQAALSLFSLDKLGNAYFLKPNLDKIKTFLKGYLSTANITREQLYLLPEVVRYNFAIYWLSYTLPAMIDRDYRLLFLIPDKKEEALYWLNGFHEYESFIASLKINL